MCPPGDKGRGTVSARILVVDDEPDILLLIKLGLETQGFEVVTAPDGPEALKQLETHVPDLMVLDAMMPGMTGFEVLESLHQSRESKHKPPVIMLTVLSELSKIEMARDLGAVEYIVKPIDFDELLVKVRLVLEKAKEEQS